MFRGKSCDSLLNFRAFPAGAAADPDRPGNDACRAPFPDASARTRVQLRDLPIGQKFGFFGERIVHKAPMQKTTCEALACWLY